MTLQNPYIWLREPLIQPRPESPVLEQLGETALVVGAIVAVAWLLAELVRRVVR